MIDSHAHLEMLEKPEEAIERSFNEGLEFIITIVEPTENWKRAIELSEKYEKVYFAAGVHPHNARLFNSDVENLLVKLLQHEKCVALGEVGLDFYYMNSPQKVQIEVFKLQLEIAEALSKPVIIHTRSAFLETISVLEEKGMLDKRTLFHCFSEGPESAVQVASRGCLISFSGNMTYPKAEQIRKSLEVVPIESVLFETDSPFLAPQPKRGKKNEPLFVRYVYEEACKIKEIELSLLVEKIRSNFFSFFSTIDTKQ